MIGAHWSGNGGLQISNINVIWIGTIHPKRYTRPVLRRLYFRSTGSDHKVSHGLHITSKWLLRVISSFTAISDKTTSVFPVNAMSAKKFKIADIGLVVLACTV